MALASRIEERRQLLRNFIKAEPTKSSVYRLEVESTSRTQTEKGGVSLALAWQSQRAPRIRPKPRCWDRFSDMALYKVPAVESREPAVMAMYSRANVENTLVQGSAFHDFLPKRRKERTVCVCALAKIREHATYFVRGKAVSQHLANGVFCTEVVR